MDDASMTYADGVRAQTAVSMIETKLSAHPPRSQVVRSTCARHRRRALRGPADRALSTVIIMQVGTGKSLYQETFSPRGSIVSVGVSGRVAS